MTKLARAFLVRAIPIWAKGATIAPKKSIEQSVFFSYDQKRKRVLLLENETAVAVLCEQVSSLKGRLDSLEKEVQTKFDRIELKLDEAIKGRPTWSIAIMLSGLMTVCTGLVVFILTK